MLDGKLGFSTIVWDVKRPLLVAPVELPAVVTRERGLTKKVERPGEHFNKFRTVWRGPLDR